VGASTTDSDAATKGYVDSLAMALRIALDYCVQVNAHSVATVSIIQSSFAITPNGEQRM
jgi:hypothetical protein